METIKCLGFRIYCSDRVGSLGVLSVPSPHTNTYNRTKAVWFSKSKKGGYSFEGRLGFHNPITCRVWKEEK